MTKTNAKLFTLICLLIALSACAGPTTTNWKRPPKIISFYSLRAPTSNGGEYIELDYSVENAAIISIDQGIGSVPCWGVGQMSNYGFEVSPTVTTTYTLTAQNDYGTVKASTTITVN